MSRTTIKDALNVVESLLVGRNDWNSILCLTLSLCVCVCVCLEREGGRGVFVMDTAGSSRKIVVVVVTVVIQNDERDWACRKVCQCWWSLWLRLLAVFRRWSCPPASFDSLPTWSVGQTGVSTKNRKIHRPRVTVCRLGSSTMGRETGSSIHPYISLMRKKYTDEYSKRKQSLLKYIYVCLSVCGHEAILKRASRRVRTPKTSWWRELGPFPVRTNR